MALRHWFDVNALNNMLIILIPASDPISYVLNIRILQQFTILYALDNMLVILIPASDWKNLGYDLLRLYTTALCIP